MILSAKHGFLFLKTAKTAGTSLEIGLAKFCGPEDIITPSDRDDEELRRSLGYRGNQHCDYSLVEYEGLKNVARYALKRKKKKKYYNHISANNVKRQVNDSVWNSVFKFCVERNPWDRVISWMYWLPQYRTLGFDAFMQDQAYRQLKGLGSSIYRINGEVVVDRVCLYENLQDELAFLQEKLSLPEAIVLPHAKSHTRPVKGEYRSYYTPAYKNEIGDFFAWEIEQYGYEF